VGGTNPDAVFGEGAEVFKRRSEAVHGGVVVGSLGLIFPLCSGRPRGRRDDRRALAFRLPPLMIVEKNRGQLLTHVPLYVVGQHAKEHVPFDALVVFEPDAPWSYWDWGAMTAELEAGFGRPIDLVEKRSVVNPHRRHHILSNRRIIHHHAA
jgi:predicted nucleotidyltransferase